MGYQYFFSSLILLIIPHILFTNSQPDFYCSKCTGNSTSAFRQNLDKLLTIMSSSTEIDKGFYNYSVGNPPNKVYGIGMCRGDDSVAKCRSCIKDSTNNFRLRCLTNNESIGYYAGNCMLRYSYRPIFGLTEFFPNCTYGMATKVPKPYVVKFRKKVGELLSELINKTVAGDSPTKFATAGVNVSGSLKAYALTQCSPDLTLSDCLACLKRDVNSLNLCCFNTTGTASYLPSCSAEFQNFKFYDGAENTSTLLSVPIPPSSSSHFRRLPDFHFPYNSRN